MRRKGLSIVFGTIMMTMVFAQGNVLAGELKESVLMEGSQKNMVTFSTQPEEPGCGEGVNCCTLLPPGVSFQEKKGEKTTFSAYKTDKSIPCNGSCKAIPGYSCPVCKGDQRTTHHIGDENTDGSDNIVDYLMKKGRKGMNSQMGPAVKPENKITFGEE